MSQLESAAQQAEAKVAQVLSKPAVVLTVLLAITLIGLFNALPHANESIWQDEAVTLLFHASRGVVQPFLQYLSPNNHIAFTSMLAAWMQLFPEGLDVFSLRMLPLLMFVAAIPVTFFAAWRFDGPICAIFASTIFASSTLSANFATQLRGYGPSWLFLSLMFLFALNLKAERHAAAWRLGYFGSCLVSVAILPTNFFFALALSIAILPTMSFAPSRAWLGSLRTPVFLIATPPICLLAAYGLVWDELMSFRSIDLSQWSRTELLQSWLIGSASGYSWILPLAGAGIAVGSQRLFQARSLSDELDRSRKFMTGVLLLVAFLAVVVAVPNTPFARTLVPYFPIWACAMAYLAINGVREVIRGTRPTWFVAGLVLFGAPLFMGGGLRTCVAEKHPAGAYDYDLCYQYFRDSYHPETVLESWATLGRSDVPIVTNYEGFYALKILGSNAPIFETSHYESAGRLPPLLVVHDERELNSMSSALGAAPGDYQLFADTGYFIIYAPSQPR